MKQDRSTAGEKSCKDDSMINTCNLHARAISNSTLFVFVFRIFDLLILPQAVQGRTEATLNPSPDVQPPKATIEMRPLSFLFLVFLPALHAFESGKKGYVPSN